MKLVQLENMFWVYLGAGAAFFYSLLFASFLNVEQYAEFVFTLALAAFAQITINFGSDKVFLKSLSHYELRRPQLFFIDLSFRVSIFILLVLVYAILGEKEFLTIFIWYSINSLYPKSIADYKGMILFQNRSFGIEKLISLIIILVCVFFDFSQELSFVYFLVAIRTAAIIFQYSKLNFGFSFLSLSTLIEITSFGYHFRQSAYLMIALLANAILLYGGQVYLKQFAPDNLVAIVGLGLQLCLVVQVFQAQLVRFFNKELFSGVENYSLSFLLSKIKISIVSSFVLVLFMNLVAFVLETHLLESHFNGLSWFSIAISLWLIVLGPATIISQAFIALFDTKFYMRLSIFGGALSLLLTILLIPKLLMNGYLIQLYIAHFSVVVFQGYKVLSKVKL